ncbi:hypothetical protein [Amycolatopsis sp. EV170708-02-1]|uniref:hypothetical protein n=1 Tax=Amycolatopsis sp. EV170708-02-1 TaxID=2919322 RepID=UPI001F0BE73A|nr:hypothetical protein [Amycolatopsis sp. EV170708-02-1]UMP06969.1 hypothetical protein MJQ72_20095 [Amycolatopsis sp. EV170708-02-1]
MIEFREKSSWSEELLATAEWSQKPGVSGSLRDAARELLDLPDMGLSGEAAVRADVMAENLELLVINEGLRQDPNLGRVTDGSGEFFTAPTMAAFADDLRRRYQRANGEESGSHEFHRDDGPALWQTREWLAELDAERNQAMSAARTAVRSLFGPDFARGDVERGLLDDLVDLVVGRFGVAASADLSAEVRRLAVELRAEFAALRNEVDIPAFLAQERVLSLRGTRDRAVELFSVRSPRWLSELRAAVPGIARTSGGAAERWRAEAREKLGFGVAGVPLAGDVARRRIRMQRSMVDRVAYNSYRLSPRSGHRFEAADAARELDAFRAQAQELEGIAASGATPEELSDWFDAYDTRNEAASISAFLAVELVGSADAGRGQALLEEARTGLAKPPYTPAEASLFEEMGNVVTARMRNGMPEADARALAESLMSEFGALRGGTDPPGFAPSASVERQVSGPAELSSLHRRPSAALDRLWVTVGGQSLAEFEAADELARSVFGDVNAVEGPLRAFAEDLVQAHGQALALLMNSIRAEPGRTDVWLRRFAEQWSSPELRNLRTLAERVLPEGQAPAVRVMIFRAADDWRTEFEEAESELARPWRDDARTALRLPVPHLAGRVARRAAAVRADMVDTVALLASRTRTREQLGKPTKDENALVWLADGLRRLFESLLEDEDLFDRGRDLVDAFKTQLVEGAVKLKTLNESLWSLREELSGVQFEYSGVPALAAPTAEVVRGLASLRGMPPASAKSLEKVASGVRGWEEALPDLVEPSRNLAVQAAGLRAAVLALAQELGRDEAHAELLELAESLARVGRGAGEFQAMLLSVTRTLEAEAAEFRAALPGLTASSRQAMVNQGRRWLGIGEAVPEYSADERELLDDLSLAVGRRLHATEEFRSRASAEAQWLLTNPQAAGWMADVAGGNGATSGVRAVRMAVSALAGPEAETPSSRAERLEQVERWRQEGHRLLAAAGHSPQPDTVAAVVGYSALHYPFEPQLHNLVQASRKAFSALRTGRFHPTRAVLSEIVGTPVPGPSRETASSEVVPPPQAATVEEAPPPAPPPSPQTSEGGSDPRAGPEGPGLHRTQGTRRLRDLYIDAGSDAERGGPEGAVETREFATSTGAESGLDPLRLSYETMAREQVAVATAQLARIEDPDEVSALRDEAKVLLDEPPEVIPGVGVAAEEQRAMYDALVTVLAGQLHTARSSQRSEPDGAEPTAWLVSAPIRGLAERLRVWTPNGPVPAAKGEGWTAEWTLGPGLRWESAGFTAWRRHLQESVDEFRQHWRNQVASGQEVLRKHLAEDRDRILDLATRRLGPRPAPSQRPFVDVLADLARQANDVEEPATRWEHARADAVVFHATKDVPADLVWRTGISRQQIGQLWEYMALALVPFAAQLDDLSVKAAEARAEFETRAAADRRSFEERIATDPTSLADQTSAARDKLEERIAADRTSLEERIAADRSGPALQLDTRRDQLLNGSEFAPEISFAGLLEHMATAWPRGRADRLRALWRDDYPKYTQEVERPPYSGPVWPKAGAPGSTAVLNQLFDRWSAAFEQARESLDDPDNVNAQEWRTRADEMWGIERRGVLDPVAERAWGLLYDGMVDLVADAGRARGQQAADAVMARVWVDLVAHGVNRFVSGGPDARTVSEYAYQLPEEVAPFWRHRVLGWVIPPEGASRARLRRLRDAHHVILDALANLAYEDRDLAVSRVVRFAPTALAVEPAELLRLIPVEDLGMQGDSAHQTLDRLFDNAIQRAPDEGPGEGGPSGPAPGPTGPRYPPDSGDRRVESPEPDLYTASPSGRSSPGLERGDGGPVESSEGQVPEAPTDENLGLAVGVSGPVSVEVVVGELDRLAGEEFARGRGGVEGLLGRDLFGLRRAPRAPVSLLGLDYSVLDAAQGMTLLDRVDMLRSMPGAEEVTPAALASVEQRVLSADWRPEELLRWESRGVDPNTLPDRREIPNTLHEIWLGGPLAGSEDARVRQRNLVESAARLGGQGVLWTDVPRAQIKAVLDGDPAESLARVREMVEWARVNGVRLVNVDEVFNADSPMRLDPYFRTEMHKLSVRGYVTASDILRVEILHRFGGLYLDGDDLVQDASVLEQVNSSPDGYAITTNKSVVDGVERWENNNNAIVLAMGHPFARAYLAQIEENYGLSQHNLLPPKIIFMRKQIFDTSGGRMRQDEVMWLAGPELFTKLRKRIGVAWLPIVQGVSMNSTLSWVQPMGAERRSAGPPLAASEDLAATVGLTAKVVHTLVRQLYNRPGTLHLTAVRDAIARHADPDLVLTAAVSYLASVPELRSRVRTVTFHRFEGGRYVAMPVPGAVAALLTRTPGPAVEFLGEALFSASLASVTASQAGQSQRSTRPVEEPGDMAADIVARIPVLHAETLAKRRRESEPDRESGERSSKRPHGGQPEGPVQEEPSHMPEPDAREVVADLRGPVGPAEGTDPDDGGWVRVAKDPVRWERPGEKQSDASPSGDRAGQDSVHARALQLALESDVDGADLTPAQVEALDSRARYLVDQAIARIDQGLKPSLVTVFALEGVAQATGVASVLSERIADHASRVRGVPTTAAELGLAPRVEVVPETPVPLPHPILDDRGWAHSVERSAEWMVDPAPPTADQVDAARAGVDPAVVSAEDVGPTEALVRPAVDGGRKVKLPRPFWQPIAYDLRRLEVSPGKWVQEYTVRLNFVAGDGKTDVTAMLARTEAAVDRFYNKPGYRLPGGDGFRVRVEHDPSARTITVDAAGTNSDQLRWAVDADESVLAHELGHFLGLYDEYVRVVRDAAGKVVGTWVFRGAGASWVIRGGKVDGTGVLRGLVRAGSSMTVEDCSPRT